MMQFNHATSFLFRQQIEIETASSKDFLIGEPRSLPFRNIHFRQRLSPQSRMAKLRTGWAFTDPAILNSCRRITEASTASLPD